VGSNSPAVELIGGAAIWEEIRFFAVLALDTFAEPPLTFTDGPNG
jgi:hypothetical protein